jgi:hypothetical protein
MVHSASQYSPALQPQITAQKGGSMSLTLSGSCGTSAPVDSEAVRQSIREPEDVYPEAAAFADLLGRGVLLFLIWLELFATPLDSNLLMTL